MHRHHPRIPPANASAAARGPGSLLSVTDLVVEYPVGQREVVHAVSGITLDVRKGETLGLVGESGCGKSSAARAMACLPRPKSGTVVFEGAELTCLTDEELRSVRPRLQMIFQDPISSLNPRRKVGDIVGEPLAIWRHAAVDSSARVREMLELVGLAPDMADLRPFQLSGGQCQRVSIARALMLEPALLICDEPVSALDVSVQAQILNLLEDLKDRYDLTMIFVAHDLAVVRNVSDRTAVMYLGKLCEIGNTDAVFDQPAHPYTSALIASIPEPDPDVPPPAPIVAGELPSPVHPPSGCRFRTRCPKADTRCSTDEPVMTPVSSGHWVACHHPNLTDAGGLG